MARTKAQFKKLHRELWQWLADNPDKKKEDWQKFKGTDVPLSYCFACSYVINEYGPDACPRMCPCDWKVKSCLEPSSPFYKWEGAKTDKLRTKYALLVRDAWK